MSKNQCICKTSPVDVQYCNNAGVCKTGLDDESNKQMYVRGQTLIAVISIALRQNLDHAQLL